MRAFDNGAVGFLSKPFDEDELIECLNAAIRLRVAQARQIKPQHVFGER
jgi:FixJ family two-component response regulator